MYINFSKCQQIATSLLAKQHLRTAKINVMKLQYDKNIAFYSIQNYARTVNEPIAKYYQKGELIDGCTVNVKDLNLYIVLYNEKLCKSRVNWTLAHEIGHIYMKHMEDTDVAEVEAHFFAAQLLMPEYVLYKMNTLYGDISVDDILGLFYVSKDAAEKRMTTFFKKTYYSCSSNDCKLWDMLDSDVFMYYNNKFRPTHPNPLPFEGNSREFISLENEWLYGFL